MSDEFEKDNADVEKLDQMGRLVDKYAQSRALGLWMSVAVLLINAILVLGSIQCLVMAV